MRNSIKIALCAASALTGSMPAVAQVEDIVVTAQKRSENLQDVPISISAVTSDTLQSAGVKGTEDLQIAVPGIQVSRQNTSTQFYIRGIGTTGAAAGQEAATAVFVDGVYMPSMTGSTLGLNNIERVEVLKGPQGTLYGRNATAGAVNVITRTPSTDTHANAEFGYGNYDTVDASTYITTGLADNVAIDFAGRYANQGNGFGRNVTTGGDANKRREYALRTKLYGDFGALKLTAAADYSKETGDTGVTYRPTETGVLLSGQKGYSYGFYDIQADATPVTRVVNKGISGRVEYDAGPITITSITAYRDVSQFTVVDFDASELPLAKVLQTEGNGQFTEELQFASSNKNGFDWIVGLFYLDSYAKYAPFALEGAFAAPFVRQNVLARQDTKSYAAYAQATLDVWQDARITVGARYTIDKRELTASVTANSPAGTEVSLVPEFSKQETFKKPQWRIALDQRLNSDVLLYASYSRGFKSGVYNLTDPFNPVVRPETLDAFEVGVKSDLFDRRLRFNVAGFYYLYDDIQLTSLIQANQQLLNAAKAKVYGIDVDFNAVPVENLNIRGGGQWLHARYTNFPGVPIVVPGVAGNATVSCPDPSGALPNSPGFCDGSGNRMIKTPDIQFTFGVDYTIPLASGSGLTFTADWLYNDGFFWEPANRTRQKSYSLVNGQVRWTNADKSVFVRVWARNLLDKEYYNQIVEAVTGDIGTPAAPRTYGASVGFSF